MTPQESAALDKAYIAVAIEDAALGQMRVTTRFAKEWEEVGNVPMSVIAYCRYLDKRGGSDVKRA